jgi:YidC/Oxa1 family membrane protein insertase
VGNYGVAIILLTVLVRGCMFPLSIRQTRGAQKMQELQPEIKRIAEKYKNNPEAKVRAQQELFRKHNYNPLSGCLIILLQFPVFIGLYRGLAVDVELRQAPLISESIRWCSNLAAPDMLFPWHGFMPGFVTDSPSSGLLSILFLGPYFNLLPVLTITLFILQQKMFMPPATDDQQRTQQKMMKFMMVFMGLIFFKVASGLCLYFIATSLWGLAERKLLPKTSRSGSGDSSTPAKPKPPAPKPAPPKPAQPETPLSKLLRSSPDNDGAARRKKKKKKKRSRGRR